MAAQYAFVMKDMTKSFPGAQKPVLNHINLQFYHGAKIGIVGPNGAGKSTLMKIMAGIDKDFQGEAWPGENITVGYLPQEPQLDPTKNVLENVKDGAREVADMVDRFNAISAEMGDPKDDTDFDALMEEMGTLQEKIDAVDGWTLDNQLEIAFGHDRFRMMAGDLQMDRARAAGRRLAEGLAQHVGQAGQMRDGRIELGGVLELGEVFQFLIGMAMARQRRRPAGQCDHR